MTLPAPRSSHPGRPLLWLPRPSERGTYPRTCLGERPAALLPEETETESREAEREAWREELAEARARAADLGLAVALLVAGSVERERERGEQMAATFEALAHSEALAREDAAAEALARLMGAVVTVEARARRGDPAGAALMLCRWLEKMRGTGTVPRAMVGSNETARDAQTSGPGREGDST